MATINQLSTIDSLQDDDLIPLYDQSNDDARKASLNTLATYMATKSDFGVFILNLSSAGGDFSSVMFSENQGFYVRQGKRVHIQGSIKTDAITVGSASGDVYLTGLPFAASNAGTGARSAVSLGNVNSFPSDHPCGGYIERNESQIRLEKRTTANGATTPLQVSDLDTGVNANVFVFSADYYID